MRALALLAVLTSLALAGCGTTLQRFPHRAHLLATGCGGPNQPRCATCSSCHLKTTEAGTSVSVPGAAICKDCHGSKDLGRWSGREPDDRGVRAGLVFPHGRHLPLEEFRGQCVRCHGGVVDDGATKSAFPTMDTCLGSCHGGDFNRGKCTGCHEPASLRSLAPRTFLRHDVGFLRNHGVVATSQGQVCSGCHDQRHCTDCHDDFQSIPLAVRLADRIARELPHRADFITRHPLEARSAPATCLRCHTVSRCEGCHLERGVSANRLGSRNPHPIGWVGPNTASRDFHGRAARRDILTCAACHDQGPATNCIRCHRVGGGGGNPHPSGWRSARSSNEAMCRYCHVP